MKPMVSNFKLDKKTGESILQVKLSAEETFALIKFAVEDGITPGQLAYSVLSETLEDWARSHMSQIKGNADGV